MAIKIGHASIDERGKASGGAAGDSTGKEVCTRTWYNGNWNVVLRPKNATLAEKSAKACEAACANDKIGYDQGQRNTLYTHARKVNFDLSKITTPCETDCSALMHTCAIAGGANLTYGSNGLCTFNMVNAFMATGQYIKLTEAKYLTSDAYLKRGDILVRESGHTAMALENGANANGSAQTGTTSTGTTSTNKTNSNNAAVDPARLYEKYFSRAYRVTASSLNLRTGAGTHKKIIMAMPKGTRVTCYGYYTLHNETTWLLVQLSDGTIGYCSKNYLD